MPPGPARELVDLFARLRRSRDLPSGQLAIATGLAASHVNVILRGLKAPSPWAAAKIAHALGATGDQQRKAYQLAEQLGELNHHHRARGTQLTGARPASPSKLLPRAVEARPVVDVFPVAIGHYSDADLPDLDADARAGRLVDLLAPFGGQYRPWRHPARDRSADAVQRRLREWQHSLPSAGSAGELGGPAANPTAGSSVFYWVGHGWSDGTRPALAHAESPALVGGSGLEPQQLAQAIRDRQAAAGTHRAAGEASGWALVVLETSFAAQIADAVMAALHGPDSPNRLLLVAVPDGVTAPTGGFIEMLAGLLAGTYRAERRILLRDLAAQLERLLGPGNVHQRALGEAALVRAYPPTASWMSAPMDAIHHLEEVLADLSTDERNHFLIKAQGAEHGELSWFFEGREGELAQIGTWLHEARSGMLVVTGRAGSGKSALLGTVLVRSLPALRDALARRGLVAVPAPGAATPPESVFDAVIHLGGLGLAQAAARVAGATGIGPLPSRRDRDAGVASDLDFLADELARQAGQLTVLADALDESLDPLGIASSLLARLAALPAVRVLVGTRASTDEGPDTPARDENLLDALCARPPGARRPSGIPDAEDADRSETDSRLVIWVRQDQDAIWRYVTGRLRAARDYGLAGRAIPHMAEVSDQDIRLAAADVADQGQEFLFARLAAYELVADPRLLAPTMARSRRRLLRGTHQDLFGRALRRLADHDDRYPALMRALSLARGRGIPEADGIWAAIAAALAPAPGPQPTGSRSQAHGYGPVTDPDFNAAAAWTAAISGVLSQAAAYITADISAEGGEPTARSGTVYRLAHRTFAEYFSTHRLAGVGSGDSRRAAAALLRAAQTAATRSSRLPHYLTEHLSGHAAEAGMWNDLAALPGVLDRLDPYAVTADAIRTLFGRRAVPPPIAGIIGARDTLADARPADRPGLRQLATTIHSSRQVIGEPTDGWGIAAAQLRHSTVHVRLVGHAGVVTSVISLKLPDRRVVLASSSEDGTIRLWDPVTAIPVGVPKTGHDGTIQDLCVLPLPGGRTLLASAGGDGTVRLWDPATGQPAGPPLTGHAGPVLCVCALPGPPGQPTQLASAGQDGTVRLWDPATGQPAGPPLTGHAGPVFSVCALPGQPTLLASAGDDGTVRLWDPATGQPAGPPLTGHAGPVLCVCALPGPPGQPTQLASAGRDGKVRLWDPATGQPAGPPLTGHTAPVFGVCALPGPPGQPTLLASAGQDGTVRLWNPATSQPAGPPLVGHTSTVYGVCALPGQPTLLASAGYDGTVRLWNPATSQPAETGHTGGAVFDVCALPGPPGQPTLLASARQDRAVRLWDPATGQPAGPPLTGHTGAIRRVCALPAQPGQPTLLASAGHDGTIRLWNPATGQPAGPPLTGHIGPAYGVCALPAQPGQPTLLASTGHDGTIRLWNPATSQPAGPPLTGHTGVVHGVCAVPAQPGQPPLLASTGGDWTVRLWNPATGQPASPPLTGHIAPVYSVCALPGQPTLLASAGEDGTVRLWDPVTGQPVGEALVRFPETVSGLAPCATAIADCLTAHGDGTVRAWAGATATSRVMNTPPEVSAIATLITADRLELLTGDSHGRVHLCDLRADRRPSPPLRISERAVLALCPLPALTPAARVAAADGCGTITIITVSPEGRLEPGPILRGPAGPVRALCLIARPGTGTLLAAAGNDAAIWIWDLTTMHARPTPVTGPLTGHDGWIWSLAALQAMPGQPPRLASAGADRTIRLWNPLTGRVLGPPLTGHTGQVRAVITATSHHGDTVLVSAGHDGTVRLWDPGTGAPGPVIPLGIPVHALIQQPPSRASRERTSGGATLIAGLSTGILAIDLHHDLFRTAPPARPLRPDATLPWEGDAPVDQ